MFGEIDFVWMELEYYFGCIDSLWGSAFFASAKKADGKKAALRDRLCGGGPLGILLRVGHFRLRCENAWTHKCLVEVRLNVRRRTRRTSVAEHFPAIDPSVLSFL